MTIVKNVVKIVKREKLCPKQIFKKMESVYKILVLNAYVTESLLVART